MNNKELWVTVLDYSNGSIRIHHITNMTFENEMVQDTDVELWLYENDENYKESICNYMISFEKPEVQYYG